MTRTYPKIGTQAHKVLNALLDAKGEWISGQTFLRSLYLSQYHARIWDLENRFGWVIEHSEEKDEFGFVKFRIVPENQPTIETPKPKVETSKAPREMKFVEIDGVMHARFVS